MRYVMLWSFVIIRPMDVNCDFNPVPENDGHTLQMRTNRFRFSGHYHFAAIGVGSYTEKAAAPIRLDSFYPNESCGTQI